MTSKELKLQRCEPFDVGEMCATAIELKLRAKSYFLFSPRVAKDFGGWRERYYR